MRAGQPYVEFILDSLGKVDSYALGRCSTAEGLEEHCNRHRSPQEQQGEARRSAGKHGEEPLHVQRVRYLRIVAYSILAT